MNIYEIHFCFQYFDHKFLMTNKWASPINAPFQNLLPSFTMCHFDFSSFLKMFSKDSQKYYLWSYLLDDYIEYAWDHNLGSCFCKVYCPIVIDVQDKSKHRFTTKRHSRHYTQISSQEQIYHSAHSKYDFMQRDPPRNKSFKQE